MKWWREMMGGEISPLDLIYEDDPGELAELEGRLGFNQATAVEWLIQNFEWRQKLPEAEMQAPEQRLDTVRFSFALQSGLPPVQ